MAVGSNFRWLLAQAAILSAVGLAALAQGVATKGEWMSDPTSGCKVWNPHPQAGASVGWTGPCTNGLAEGAGRVRWFGNGILRETDQGQWQGGHQTGHGVQTGATGRYEGEVVDGIPQGRGTMVFAGRRYEGNFRDGKPDGAGTLTIDGRVFAGTWKNGCLVDGNHDAAFGVSLEDCR